jgi:hypothetical protein
LRGLARTAKAMNQGELRGMSSHVTSSAWGTL